MLAVFIALYLLVGLALAVGFTAGSNIVGRILAVVIWPYILLVDGTPRVRWLTHVSGQEVVIEEGEEIIGDKLVKMQTVRQWGGHEYRRIAA